MNDADTTLPDLASIPSEPLPPVAIEPPSRTSRPPRSLRSRQRRRSGIGRLLALVLACNGFVVSSAVLVAVGEPRAWVAWCGAGLFVVTSLSALSLILGLLGRGR